MNITNYEMFAGTELAVRMLKSKSARPESRMQVLSARAGTRSSGVGMVGLIGLLDQEYLSDFRYQMLRLGADESVKKILIDIDTPGGFVQGTPESAEVVRRVAKHKPVIGIAQNYCASGGQWIASQCTTLVGTPTCLFGSVGVVTVLADDSKMLEGMGVEVHAIATGREKVVGLPGVEIEESDLKVIRHHLDTVLAKFEKDIARHSRITERQVIEVSENASVYQGNQATRIGLADRIMLYEDALIEHLSESKPKTRQQVSQDFATLTDSAATEKYEELVCELSGVQCPEDAPRSDHAKIEQQYKQLHKNAVEHYLHLEEVWDLRRETERKFAAEMNVYRNPRKRK